MDLRSHYPYWLMKNGILNTYPSLKKDINIDVAIIGAGISGALIAYQLSNAGINAAIIDSRHPGMGSTAASTALLQYEIDKPVIELSKIIGEKNAIKSYQACRKALHELRAICQEVHTDSTFPIKPSLQYASSKKDRQLLHQEFNIRHKHGFTCDWLEPADIQNLYGFEAPGAILTAEAGELDAFLLTHKLLEHCSKQGMHIYDNTLVTKVTTGKNYSVLETASGNRVIAKRVVMATGYESLAYINKPVATLFSTYALVTEPLPQKEFWYKNSLVWETSMPYIYFRATDDGRILIGGKDDAFYDPDRRDARIGRKAQQLIDILHKKLPNYRLKADFCWAGTFAATEDGLPYIGTIPEMRNTWFALGYGGNGIIFSVIAAGIIRDAITGKKNKLADIFSFSR
jgi:glycine/D-amino acid oxidase-like deaminating enzyme